MPQQFSETIRLIETLQKALEEMKKESQKLMTTGDQQAALDLSASQDKVNATINNEINKQQADKENKLKAQELVEGNKEQEKNNSLVGKALKQFSIYAILLRTIKKVLQEVKTTIVSLDKSLTEQAMVTSLTRQQTYKLLKSYQELAAQTGATTKEVASVATEYMKQGKSIQDALTLTQAAVSAAKIAGISTADSVNYLTTALNGFRLSAEDAMSVSDKFAAVAASSATDYNELAVALSKVASQANLAGMSIDYTTALLAKGLETTREAPETMGTALKTIIARMREMSDFGETLEGDTDVNNVERQLAYVDIALKNTNGELRSTEDVLDELGRKWNTLSTNQQAAIAKALAGTRQQSRLIAMMDDYDRVIELQQISLRSAGATSAQAATYLEGLEASINKINVAVEKLVSTLSNSEWIQGIVNAIGSLLEGINSILNNSLGMQIVFSAISMIVGQMLVTKSKQVAITMKNHQLEKSINKELIKQRILEKKNAIEAKKTAIAKQASAIATQEELIANIKSGKITSTSLVDAEATLARLKQEQAMNESNLKLDQMELNNLQKDALALGVQNNTVVDNIGIGVSSIGGGILSAITGSQA